MSPKPLFDFIDKYYVILMAIVASMVIPMNYHAMGMARILNSYLDIKQIILSGFDLNVSNTGTPTFPMWGYAWLFILTENKLVILMLQNCLALFAVWLTILSLEKNKVLTTSSIVLLKFLLIISIPWYAFHSLRWPYSIAISLFTISFILLIKAFSSKELNLKLIILSGILFGLMLNFRSDYILMPIGFIAILIAFLPSKKLNFIKSIIWLPTIYIMLIPWVLYSKKMTDHYLLTSTNSGMVFFIGLGVLPDNKWGIIPSDLDPVAKLEIRKHFGKDQSPLTYETDQFLKKKFLMLIKEDPAEYGKKIIHTFKKLLLGGVYQGEFFEAPECQPKCYAPRLNLKKNLLSNPSAILNFTPREIFLYCTHTYSSYFGVMIVAISIFMMPFTTFYALLKKNIFLILILSTIAYQTTLILLSNYLPSYMANVYFFHLINICYGINLLFNSMPRLKTPQTI